MKLYIGGRIIKTKTEMKINKKSLGIIKFDSEIMDCFESDEELAVISGGFNWKDIIKIIKDIPDFNLNCGNCDCTNDGCTNDSCGN